MQLCVINPAEWNGGEITRLDSDTPLPERMVRLARPPANGTGVLPHEIQVLLISRNCRRAGDRDAFHGLKERHQDPLRIIVSLLCSVDESFQRLDRELHL